MSATMLEAWQWAEAEADFRCGISAHLLAERYGIDAATVRKHMWRVGVRSPDADKYCRSARNRAGAKKGA